MPVGQRRASSGARPRPPSTGSSAIRRRTAPGCTSTTPTTTRLRRGIQRGSPRRGDDGPLPGRRGGTARGAALRRPRHRMGARPARRARRLGRARGRRAGHDRRDRAPGRRARHAPRGDRRHALRRRADELGRFLVAQTEPSGAVLASYDPARGAPVPGEYSKYYTGEAYWALARLHRAFPGEGWGEAADRIGAYLATVARRGRGPLAADPRPLGRVRRWRRPWSSPSAAARRSPTDEMAYARRQAELFGAQVRWVCQHLGPWGELVRGSYVPRGGGYGVVGEALTGLVADRARGAAAGRPARPDRRARHLHRRRSPSTSSPTPRTPRAPRSRSGSRARGSRDGETRMDDQQHALAGLLRTIPIVEARRGRPVRRRRRTRHRAGCGPPCWCWRSTRPGRRSAFLAPGARRGTPPALAAAGGADRRARRLRRRGARRPAARRARRQRALVPHRRRDRGRHGRHRRPLPAATPARTGARRLARRARPGRDPAGGPPRPAGAGAGRGRRPGRARDRRRDGAGRRAADRADGRVRPTEGPRGRALRWAGRLLGAALVACGVLLTIDGVLDV